MDIERFIKEAKEENWDITEQEMIEIQKFITVARELDWEITIREIGENSYYYLGMKTCSPAGRDYWIEVNIDELNVKSIMDKVYADYEMYDADEFADVHTNEEGYGIDGESYQEVLKDTEALGMAIYSLIDKYETMEKLGNKKMK